VASSESAFLYGVRRIGEYNSLLRESMTGTAMFADSLPLRPSIYTTNPSADVWIGHLCTSDSINSPSTLFSSQPQSPAPFFFIPCTPTTNPFRLYHSLSLFPISRLALDHYRGLIMGRAFLVGRHSNQNMTSIVIPASHHFSSLSRQRPF
jgi:hypothetical protein